MQIDIRGAAAMMNVPESTIRRWVTEKNLPAAGVEGKYRFGRTELLEWATANKISLSPDAFEDAAPHSEAEHQLLADALATGGVFYDVPGGDTQDVLRAVIGAMSLPADVDVALLLELLLTREKLGSTAVGGGIAIPHARHPLVLPVDSPLVSLSFLEQPIDLGPSQGESVHTLFMLLSPTVSTHLQMLARIARVLRDDHFRQVLSARKPSQDILLEVRRLEQKLEQDSRGQHRAEH